jgi:competence protein ComEA
VRWSRAEQWLVLFASAAVLVGAGALLATRRPAPSIRIFEAPPARELVVQVDGAVVRPGMYRLPPGARVADALAAAGGAAADADLTAVNRARLLHDGERLSVPLRRAGGEAPGAVEPSGAVDLNSADADLLDRLPGIGPVLARRIVAHRDRAGPFRRVDELLQVEGIGPRLLERLRPHVVVR